MKYFIISQPKSGTYLCSNILNNLGINQTYYHFTPKHIYKYDKNNLDAGITNPENYIVQDTVENVLLKIKDNDFAVGHLSYKEPIITLLKPFKKIILHRNPTEAGESYNRWITESNRKRPFRDKVKNTVKEWINEPNTIYINFDSMINKDLTVINQLQEFLFGHIKENSLQILEKSLSNKSLTKSSIR